MRALFNHGGSRLGSSGPGQDVPSCRIVHTTDAHGRAVAGSDQCVLVCSRRDKRNTCTPVKFDSYTTIDVSTEVFDHFVARVGR